MKYIIFSIGILLVVSSCKRPGQPFSNICPSKESYKVTDTIKMVNCSQRATKQRWELPDGSQSTDNTVYYVPPGAGTYEFRLYVSSDKFVNEFEAIHFTTVK